MGRSSSPQHHHRSDVSRVGKLQADANMKTSVVPFFIFAGAGRPTSDHSCHLDQVTDNSVPPTFSHRRLALKVVSALIPRCLVRSAKRVKVRNLARTLLVHIASDQDRSEPSLSSNEDVMIYTCAMLVLRVIEMVLESLPTK